MDFATLLPDVIFDAVFAQGYRPTGALFPLNSYENRVYEIAVEDHRPLIAKFYRPNRWTLAQIQEEHLFIQAVASAEIPCVEPLPLSSPLAGQNTLAKAQEYYYCFFSKFRGREEADLTNDHRRWLGRSLGRLHNAGASFRAKHRPQLDPETYGYRNLEWLLKQTFIRDDLKSSLETHLLTALDLTESFFTAGLVFIPVHGDCHMGNVLWNREGPHLLDFDDMVFAPPVQDIWMLFYGDDAEKHSQREAFFEGYETFRRFDHSTLILCEPLRTLRMINHAAWIGKRYAEPAFQKAFPYYQDNRYWEEFLLDIKEQIALLQEN